MWVWDGSVCKTYCRMIHVVLLSVNFLQLLTNILDGLWFTMDNQFFQQQNRCAHENWKRELWHVKRVASYRDYQPFDRGEADR